MQQAILLKFIVLKNNIYNSSFAPCNFLPITLYIIFLAHLIRGPKSTLKSTKAQLKIHDLWSQAFNYIIREIMYIYYCDHCLTSNVESFWVPNLRNTNFSSFSAITSSEFHFHFKAQNNWPHIQYNYNIICTQMHTNIRPLNRCFRAFAITISR